MSLPERSNPKALGLLAEFLGNNDAVLPMISSCKQPKRKTAFPRISWADQQVAPVRVRMSPSSEKQSYPPSIAVLNLWQARQTSVSGSFASRYSETRTSVLKA